MTEKTLDERVAEALGFKLLEHGGEIVFLCDSGASIGIYEINGFFTQSVDNCWKRIIPLLIALGYGLLIEYEPHYTRWMVGSATSRKFKAWGKTLQEAICNALLDLKEREDK